MLGRKYQHSTETFPTYRLNWARKTSWGWWDDWDDTVLQTQHSKFESWRCEAEHASSRSRRLLAILTFTRGWGGNIFVSFKPPRPGAEPRTLPWKAVVLTTTLGPAFWQLLRWGRRIARDAKGKWSSVIWEWFWTIAVTSELSGYLLECTETFHHSSETLFYGWRHGREKLEGEGRGGIKGKESW